MTERKLTPEQIDYLFSFVEQRDVKYYDVQMELVDHFASAIEQRWKTNSELTFSDILQKEYRQFNNYDFNQIIEEKESALKKKYLSLQWRYIGEFFKLPKILMTITITLSLFTAFELSNKSSRTYAIVYLIAFISFIIVGFVQKNKTKLNLMTSKSLLLFEEYKRIRAGYLASLNFVNIMNLPIFLGKDHFYFYLNFVFIKLLISFLITMLGMFCYVLMVYLPQRIKADFTREFPQFVKA